MFEPLIEAYLPMLLVAAFCVAALGLGHYVLLVRRRELGSEARLPRQLLLLLLSIVSVVLIIIVAPMPEAAQNQILSLLGIVLSGVVALSSAPFVTNFMAAIMLRVTKPFAVGDFIKVGELYGKVSERGLFDTEIQTQFRELIAIPNATFINQSVTVVRSSGVIISTEISLGYDLSYGQTEPLMLEAAKLAGLSDPYVHIIELQDSSVNYRVCGLLSDVEGALTARSELNRQLLSTLHGAGIEVASPSIARHISYPADTPLIPPVHPKPAPAERVKAEEIVFDKAREIERLEQDRAKAQQLVEEIRSDKDSSTADRESVLEDLKQIELELKELMEKP